MPFRLGSHLHREKKRLRQQRTLTRNSWRGPEVSVLRTSGLFDRLADEKALGALLKLPAIRGLTESLS
jgi:hypothetical protein